MPAIDIVWESDRFPKNTFFEKSFRVTTEAASGNHWIETGFASVSYVVGWAFYGTSTAGNAAVFKLNSDGTGSEEPGTSPGYLAVETSSATDFQVTVGGRL